MSGEEVLGQGALGALGAHEVAASTRAVPMAKPRLLALTSALHRTFASSFAVGLAAGRSRPRPALVVAFFQRRAYFDAERTRFEALAALGVTTLVGFPGAAGDLPPGVEHVDVVGRPELEDAWVLAAFDGALGMAIVAVDDKGLVDAPTLEASRRFVVRCTIEPAAAAVALRRLLAPLRARLARRTLSEVEAALRGASATDGGASGTWLATLVTELVPRFEIEALLPGRDDLAEQDLLTGVRNRVFLERYLPRAPESAARVALVLVDVDDLGRLNDRHGHAAGDTALVAVADALAAERRAGDVLVRYCADEFVVLAPVDGPEAALALARRLVVAVRAARLDFPFESEQVTVSAAAVVSDPAAFPFARLERGVAQAKALGKNRAVVVGR